MTRKADWEASEQASVSPADAIGVPITELSVLSTPKLSLADAHRIGQLGQALGHPLRAEITAALMLRPAASPVELARGMGQVLGNVAYHVRTLANAGFIEARGMKPRAGTIEHFYALRPELRAALVALGGPISAQPDDELISRKARSVAKLGKALSHPVRAQIAALLGEVFDLSPVEMAAATEESLGMVSYHVRGLLNADLVELTRTAPRRGAIQHYYALRPQLRRALAALTEALDADLVSPSDPRPLPPDGRPETTRARDFGNRFRSARQQAALTIEDVAAHANLSRDEVVMIEDGESEPRLSVILRLARAIDTPPNELLRGMR